jgi:hypothetical protein
VRQLWDGKSLTTFDLDDYVYVYEALRAGASGFLLKDARADELRQAVRTVESGDALLSPAITRPPDRELHTPASTDRAPNPPLAELTPRELEVLRLLARGLSKRQHRPPARHRRRDRQLHTLSIEATRTTGGHAVSSARSQAVSNAKEYATNGRRRAPRRR